MSATHDKLKFRLIPNDKEEPVWSIDLTFTVQKSTGTKGGLVDEFIERYIEFANELNHEFGGDGMRLAGKPVVVDAEGAAETGEEHTQ